MKRSKCEGGNTVITVLGFADKEIKATMMAPNDSGKVRDT